MKAVNLNNNKRHKAFIGAAVGATAQLVGGIVGGIKQKKAAKEQAKEDAKQQAIQDTVNAQQQASAMSSSYNDQDYVDDVKNKISLKNGGTVKTKDRIKYAKDYNLVSRKKAAFGAAVKEGTAAASGASGLIGSILGKPKVEKAKNISAGYSYGEPKKVITPNSYMTDIDNNSINSTTTNGVSNTVNLNDPRYKDRLSMAKMGKRVCKK